MQRLQWPLAGLVLLVACGEDGPSRAPFGLDKRPSNTTCLAKKRPVIDTGVALQRQWMGVAFNQPIYLTQAPGDDTQWYVVGRLGTVQAFPANATMTSQLRSFASVTVNASGEGGLLGFAFHPDWPNKREAYLSYTRNVVAGDPPAPVCPNMSGNPFNSVISRFQS